MTTKVWEDTIPFRPISKKSGVEGKKWTQGLRQRLEKTNLRTCGSVKAAITVYIDQTNPDQDGDLDNYAKIILDQLETSVLHSDGDIDDLHVRRIKWNRKDKTTIRLEWEQAENA